ncbi:MAG: lysostaphin resistance A-like protein [Terriglobia bacterium]
MSEAQTPLGPRTFTERLGAAAVFVFLAADRRLRPLWRAVLFVPVMLLLAFPVLYLLQVAAGGAATTWPLEWRVLLQRSGLLLALLAATYLLLRFLDRRSFRNVGLGFYQGWGRELGLGVGLGVGLQAVVVAVLVLAGLVDYGVMRTGALGALQGLGWYFIVLLPASAMEEVLFRGYPFQRLVESWGKLGAILLLAALFGWGHVNNPSATPLSTANVVLAGVLLAALYLRTRGLWLPIGFHVAWNWSMAYVFSLPVSGLVLSEQLFEVEVSGPEWLSGGNFGPEGSIVGTVALGAAVVWTARTRRLQVSPALAKEVE